MESLQFTGLGQALVYYVEGFAAVVFLVLVTRSLIQRKIKRSLVILLIGAIIAGGGYLYKSQTIDPIIITTDKQEYTKGEDVHFTIFNRSFRTVYIDYCNLGATVYSVSSNLHAQRFFDPCSAIPNVELKPRTKEEVDWSTGNVIYLPLPDEFELRLLYSPYKYSLNVEEKKTPKKATSSHFRIIEPSSSE